MPRQTWSSITSARRRGLQCDSAVYDKPGACPTYGIALVGQAAVTAAAQARKKVRDAPQPHVLVLPDGGIYAAQSSAPTLKCKSACLTPIHSFLADGV